MPDAPEWPEAERLAGEKETVGFYLSGHPLNVYLEKLREICTADSSSLEGRGQGEDVTLGGLIVSVRTARSRRGEPWAQVRLEDLCGYVDLLVFPEAYRRLAERLQTDAAVFIRGRVNPEEGGPPKVAVTDLVPLDSVSPTPLPENLIIRVRLRNGGGVAERLAELFTRKPGAARVRLELIQENDFRLTLEPQATVRPDREFLETVEQICGKGSYTLV